MLTLYLQVSQQMEALDQNENSRSSQRDMYTRKAQFLCGSFPVSSLLSEFACVLAELPVALD